MAETIDGRIRLVKELGYSQSCVFYKAEHTLLHRTVLVCLYEENAPRTENAVASQLSGFHNGKYFSAFEWADGLTADEFKQRFGISDLTESFATELQTAVKHIKSESQRRLLRKGGLYFVVALVIIGLSASVLVFGAPHFLAEARVQLARISGDRLALAERLAAQGTVLKSQGHDDGASKAWQQAADLYAGMANEAFTAADYERSAALNLKMFECVISRVRVPGDVLVALGSIARCFGQKGHPELVDPLFDCYYQAHEKRSHRNSADEAVEGQKYIIAHVFQIRARIMAGKIADAERLLRLLVDDKLAKANKVARAFLGFAEAEIADAKGDVAQALALKVKCGKQLNQMNHFEMQCAAELVLPCTVALRMNKDFIEATNVLRILDVEMAKGSELYTSLVGINYSKSDGYRVLHQKVLNDYGFTYLERRKPPEALEIFADAEQLVIPNSVDSQKAYVTLLSRRAQAYMDLGQLANVEATVEKYTALIKQNHLEMDEERWFGQSTMASVHLREKRFDKAAKYLQEAIVVAQRQNLKDGGKRVRNEAARLRDCYVQAKKMREADAVSRKYGV